MRLYRSGGQGDKFKPKNAITMTEELWEKYHTKLKMFICEKVQHDDCCHDILHDLFLKIRDNEEKIVLLQRPISYMIKMAQNAVIDYYRSQKARKTEWCDCNYTEISQELPDGQFYSISILSFIDNLPAIYKEALVLSELRGLSQKQLAQHLNISYTGAKSRVQRGRQLLKESILKCCDYRFDKYGNLIGCCE